MIELPEEFKRRMAAQLKGGYAEFLSSYALPPVKGVRVNPLKIPVRDFKKIAPVKLGDAVEWESDGFYAEGESLGKTLLHFAGLYYVQEPSAMSAVPELNTEENDRVLDLCSAPGGKGTQIAGKMNGAGVLVLNESDPKRYKTLCSNVERMGVKNAAAVSADPKNLEDVFAEYFTKILVDAPCSGEGMFKKEEAALANWSVKNIEACAVRQSKILQSAYKMLAPGGRLVYSTCTFAPEEDEEQICSFLRERPDCKLLKMKKLLPHEVRGEGHFVAVIQKDGCGGEQLTAQREKPSTLLKIYREWEKSTLNSALPDVYISAGGSVFSVKDELLAISKSLERKKIPVRAGVLAGSIADGKRFEPAHPLAMCLKSDEVKHIELDYDTALSYLRGRTFECDKEKGWYAVTYLGFPLGWCKVVEGIAKNHLPKGLRI